MFALPFSLPAAPFIWIVAALATLGVLTRPFRWPEAVWPICGALLLCVGGALPWSTAWHAVGRGNDVYLFLTGMMLTAETAREAGLFDYAAQRAARLAGGSAPRLFLLVYAVGTVVTVFLSNDATAVVLTPAVIAMARTVETKAPLPYLYACAFIANAASFVLPISNPANLVVFNGALPALSVWLIRFTVPSLVAIGVTYITLRLLFRRELRAAVSIPEAPPPLDTAGKFVAAGVAGMALVMVAASAAGWQLGWPTFAAGVVVLTGGCLVRRTSPVPTLRSLSWGILPLVAGLFVLVEALQSTHVLSTLQTFFQASTQSGGAWQNAVGTLVAGVVTAVTTNVVNNLPAGLIAGTLVQHSPSASASVQAGAAVLVGIDLGPNLSVTGSLATLLWLSALRRDKLQVSAGNFLKVGALVMFPALIATLLVLVGTVAIAHASA